MPSAWFAEDGKIQPCSSERSQTPFLLVLLALFWFFRILVALQQAGTHQKVLQQEAPVSIHTSISGVTANASSPHPPIVVFQISCWTKQCPALNHGVMLCQMSDEFFQLPFWNHKRFLSFQSNHIAAVLNILSTTCFLLLIQSRTTDSKLLPTWALMILARSAHFLLETAHWKNVCWMDSLSVQSKHDQTWTPYITFLFLGFSQKKNFSREQNSC